MALLTAEDVLNKAFSKTKYREGFDQDEVDDFLDEVANTIAQLTAERDEALARAGGAAAAAPVAPPATAAGGVPGTTGLLAAATDPGAANPTGMLAMAQKLHDEYVQAGEAERDRIVDEAHASADQIRERADEDAKARMDELAGDRADLEGRIDDLRRFERDYRARLKTYLENLLGDLDHSGVAGAAGAAGLAAVAADNWPGDDAAAAADDAAAEEAASDEAAGGEAAPGDAAPAGEYGASQEFAPEAGADDAEVFIVEETVTAEVFEGADGEPDVVVVDEYETVTPVSFDEAISGVAPEQQPEAAAQDAEWPSTPPSFDVSQPWESQLGAQTDAAQANPFAPVTQPAEGEAAPAAEDGSVQAAPAEEGEEAPYTPPSSRMFNDLYGQQRPEQGN